MRKIHGNLTIELSAHTTVKTVGVDAGYKVKSYEELVKQVAKLSYKNKDFLLFYRGQKADYKNKADSSTFYPTIYRGDPLSKEELEYRFDLLESASKMLCYEFKSREIEGYQELNRKKYIQWSVLQHYEVTDTPLSDVTQSLRVACSFAQLDNRNNTAYVYVFGLPYYTNRISINSEHDLVNIRLLSITPPSALRPYFQEGFLIGTEDITTDYLSKDELDLNRRLIAKFEIPNTDSFWGNGFDRIPETALYPDNDGLKIICDEIKSHLTVNVIGSESLGDFLKRWTKLQNKIIDLAKKYEANVFRHQHALIVLMDNDPENSRVYKDFKKLTSFRNKLVHDPSSVTNIELNKRLIDINGMESKLLNK
ncbi:hypothetical protein GCM10009133_13030 [Cocleimonas flava]|uniref:FRG domain-containing protein n=1 Tax=Cocleimonas flava TaxID=634765 RepID=A0A4R1F543_9GAMM|nr:FRG domain-containing protein [Cocleimonas flava]TCJ87669.1 FRG domain-containing protein [Cocleimonas flava]